MNIQPNVLYHADALALLERTDSEMISLVYLDPPWYSDAGFISSRGLEIQDQPVQSHRAYLTYLSKVLQQCRRVLLRSGNIFVHLDPRISSDFRQILDQVFGRENFRCEFVWRNLLRHGTASLRPTHEVIVLYSKSEAFTYNQVLRPIVHEESPKSFSKDEHGPYSLGALTSPLARPSHQFEWDGLLPMPGHSWRYSRHALDQFKSEGRIYRPSATDFPRLKMYAKDGGEIDVGSVWDDIPPVRLDGDPKYPGQKPRALLDRIVQMGSNAGDVLLDPFCGSGTALVVAHVANRKWIGCDISQEAISVTEVSLARFGAHQEQDYSVGTENDLRSMVRVISFYYPPLFLPGDLPTRPLIITEGKTDWKHLKASLVKLKAAGRYSGFELDFLEYEDEIKMGSGDLKNLCRSLSKVPNPRKVICIFDRDEPGIVAEVSGKGAAYRSWGNNIYSFALPVPNHRRESDGICVELYYQDRELKRKDSQGRRLFLSREFNPSVKHNGEMVFWQPQDGARGQRLLVIDDKVFNGQNENMALSKSRFAEYVLAGTKPFHDLDSGEFSRVFDVIVEISLI